MRFLVTGGAGFIGSNLVRALVAEHEVGVIDDLTTGHRNNVPLNVWFRRLDITDGSLAPVIAEFAPDVVIHLAAQASVARSLKDPHRDWQVNVEGTRAVARAAASAHARCVISASSAAVYGNPVEVPLTETAQKVPESPYGHSKLAAEAALAEELAPTPLDFASFRFSNVYGPRQDAEGEGGVVAIFSAALARGTAPVIFGTGEQTRDFIFVDDVVAAIIAGATAEASLREGGGLGPAYNVSTGTSSSVTELATMLSGVAEIDVTPQHGPARDGDIAHSSLDPRKARDVFAWDARVPLDVGLATTYEWFRERG